MGLGNAGIEAPFGGLCLPEPIEGSLASEKRSGLAATRGSADPGFQAAWRGSSLERVSNVTRRRLRASQTTLGRVGLRCPSSALPVIKSGGGLGDPSYTLAGAGPRGYVCPIYLCWKERYRRSRDSVKGASVSFWSARGTHLPSCLPSTQRFLGRMAISTASSASLILPVTRAHSILCQA